MLFLFAVMLIAGNINSAQIPQSLPIGSAFPPPETWITWGIGYNDPRPGYGGDSVLHSRAWFDKSKGPLENKIQEGLEELTLIFMPPKGTESYDYWIDVDVRQKIKGVGENLHIVSTYPTTTFKLIEGINGKLIVPPEAMSDMVMRYQAALPVAYIPGLTWVKVESIWRSILGDEVIDSYEGPHGAPCNAPPDTLTLWDHEVIPWVPPPQMTEHIGGQTTVFLNKERTDFAIYDLKTGELTASSSIRLWVTSATDQSLVAPQKQRETTTTNVRLEVAGPTGESVTLQYSDNLVDWEPLTTLILYGGLTEYVDVPSSASQKFYRARSDN